MNDKGAHWFRCDLQVHTPRDCNWQGTDRISDEDREAYAALLVAACRERGLQSIAITDHHDLAFVEYVRRAASEELDEEGNRLRGENRLVVFPGIELTLGVPCQALLIFDAEFPLDLFSLAMTALTITPSAASESKTIETVRVNTIQSLRQLKENTGSKVDALVAATSPAATDVELMTENVHGLFGTMGPLRELRIPAHGRASLLPGHYHVMLEQPTVTFKVGQTVLVTLRFKWAGSVTIKVPVVPLSWILRR